MLLDNTPWNSAAGSRRKSRGWIDLIRTSPSLRPHRNGSDWGICQYPHCGPESRLVNSAIISPFIQMTRGFRLHRFSSGVWEAGCGQGGLDDFWGYEEGHQTRNPHVILNRLETRHMKICREKTSINEKNCRNNTINGGYPMSGSIKST